MCEISSGQKEQPRGGNRWLSRFGAEVLKRIRWTSVIVTLTLVMLSCPNVASANVEFAAQPGGEPEAARNYYTRLAQNSAAEAMRNAANAPENDARHVVVTGGLHASGVVCRNGQDNGHITAMVRNGDVQEGGTYHIFQYKAEVIGGQENVEGQCYCTTQNAVGHQPILFYNIEANPSPCQE